MPLRVPGLELVNRWGENRRSRARPTAFGPATGSSAEPNPAPTNGEIEAQRGRRLSPTHPGKEGLILISSIRLCCPPSAPLLLPPLDVPGQPSCPLAPLSSPSVKTPSHCLQLLILFLLRPLLALVFFHPQLWVCRSLMLEMRIRPSLPG